jgi:adhesin/invasin
VVTIGGQPADVSFSGLAPGFAGLYQINVTAPSNLSPGTHPISVAIGGRTSKLSGISVQ